MLGGLAAQCSTATGARREGGMPRLLNHNGVSEPRVQFGYTGIIQILDGDLNPVRASIDPSSRIQMPCSLKLTTASTSSRTASSSFQE